MPTGFIKTLHGHSRASGCLVLSPTNGNMRSNAQQAHKLTVGRVPRVHAFQFKSRTVVPCVVTLLNEPPIDTLPVRLGH